MNPAVPGLLLAGCILLAARGVSLVRSDSVGSRLAMSHAASSPRRDPLVGQFFEYLSLRLAGRAIGILGHRRLDRIRHRLEVAGRPMTVEAYAGRKATFTVLFGVVGVAFLAQGRPIIGLALIAAGVVWIDLWLVVTTRHRRDQLNRELPDFLDVLAVTVSAGVAFRTALARVADSTNGPLGDEVRLCLRQMELGVSRRMALEAMRARTDSEPLGQMVTALLQAEELGAPLSDTLVDLAVDMRRSAAQEARRRAARAGPRITLVVTLVIMPGAMILIAVGLFLTSGVDLGNLSPN